jgi:hypothetical protein
MPLDSQGFLQCADCKKARFLQHGDRLATQSGCDATSAALTLIAPLIPVNSPCPIEAGRRALAEMNGLR